MGKFAIVRLGKDSIADIQAIDALKTSPTSPLNFGVTCSQVSEDILTGDFVFICLGSDNNNGTPTEWIRGVRALGTITQKTGGPRYNDQWKVSIEVRVVLPESVTKKDLLAAAPDAYYWASDIPVLGVDTHSNQTIQVIKPNEEHQNVEALAYALAAIHPSFKTDTIAAYQQLAVLFNYSPALPSNSSNKTNSTHNVGLFASTELSNISQKFFEHTKSVNFETNISDIFRFVASLLTKRFLIATGLAGSGKSKLAEAMAYWLSEDQEKQVCMIAVGADWTNNEPLLGYADTINEKRYCAPASGVLQLLTHAIEHEDKPHFLILDEMNLSHVERYFADFLSAMESSKPKLRLHGNNDGDLETSDKFKVPAALKLPPNVFIIGTVNVDETTYMFSPKVLDRANVIEFRVSAEQMSDFLAAPASSVNMENLKGRGTHFAEAFVTRAKLDTNLKQEVASQLQQDLIELFKPLTEVGAEFGYRSAKEIARFVAIHRELSGDNWSYKEALDAQVMQKLMPKLHGSARKLSGVLNTLATFAKDKELPLTQNKVERMQKRLKDEGFTSFAEN